MQFVNVAEGEGEQPTEMPIEKDNTLLQSTLQAQSPACKRIETGNRSSSDLIVLNLPYAVTNESLLKHFETFGEIVMAEVKKDPITGVSRGYGFIRFKYSEAQTRALLSRKIIEGRLCKVKIPESCNNLNRKIFVRRCTKDLTTDDLQTYFSKFGEVVDIFTPKPFRGCCFITFLDEEVIKSLIGKVHIVKGVPVQALNVKPRPDTTITPKLTDSGISQQQISLTPKQGFDMRQNAQIGSSKQVCESDTLNPAFKSYEKR